MAIRRAHTSWNEHRIEQLRMFAAEGTSMAIAAQSLNVTVKTIKAKCKQHGIHFHEGTFRSDELPEASED